MHDLGEQLRRARQEKNLTLEEINNRTKIQLRYLEALEKGDSTPFAGEVYFKGALRNYAQILGLDPDQFLDRYNQLKQQSPPREVQPAVNQDQQPGQNRQIRKAQSSAPSPREDQPIQPSVSHRRKSLLSNWLMLLAIVMGVMVWIAISKSRKPPDLAGVAPVPEKLPAEEPISPPTAVPDEPPPLEMAFDPHQSTANETVYIVSGTEKLEVSFNFTGNCWVCLFSDDRELYQQTFKPGQKLLAEGNQKIWIRLGNPLGVRLTVNGLTVEGLTEQTTAHNYLFALQ